MHRRSHWETAVRSKKPRPASPDEVRIVREGDTAIIEYADTSISTVHIRCCPELAAMSDADILRLHNDILKAQAEVAANVDPTLTEIPPGRPQIEYSEQCDQWVPRGQVLRCHVEDTEDGETVIQIDDVELDMRAFARMLQTYAGWGMRLAFVEEDEVAYEPEIVVRDPDDEVAER